jgi:competence protein ComEC
MNNSPPYLAFLEEINKQNIATEIADSSRDIMLGQDLNLKILYPFNNISQKSFVDLNDSSIVAKLIYKNNSFLFTGDAGEAVEKDLLDNKVDVLANVLKVGHHGSKYATSQEFLEAVKPHDAVIEVGKDNGFGHPHLRALDRLIQNNIEILRTDLQGTITLVSNGIDVEIKK